MRTELMNDLTAARAARRAAPKIAMARLLAKLDGALTTGNIELVREAKAIAECIINEPAEVVDVLRLPEGIKHMARLA